MAFIDDSPPLQKWDSGGEVVDVHDESDRSSGRVVLGTATGDLYVFLQSGVRLVPREVKKRAQRNTVKEEQCGDGNSLSFLSV